MPAPDYEVKESTAVDVAVNTIMAKRVADYLPEKRIDKTLNPKAREHPFWLFYSVFTGGFLALEDKLITTDRQVTSQAKENLINECTNTGLISALLLTIVLPMSYDAVTDWLEEDYVGSGFIFGDGYIAGLLTETQVQNGLAFMNDFALIFYVMGMFGFLASTCLTVVQLLCVGEVASDSGCEDFLRRVGKAARAPYILFMLGCVFALPAIVRYVVSCKTLPGLIILMLVVAVMALFCILMAYVYVASCTRVHNRINEFVDLNLSNTEAQQDVEAWFEKNTTSGTHVQDCLLDLSAIVEDKKSNSELIIPLDALSKQRVALHYHKLRSESVGITLPAAELYKLSCQLPE